jgi:hypothetical protein
MKKYILNYLPFYGVSIFIICNALAMYYYPGGSIFNNESVGYDFFRNFLSQLGQIKAYIVDDNGNQLSNMISFRIWSSGMATTGLIFCIYYFCLPSFFKNKKLSILGSFFAIVAAICFMLTGITPGDTFIHISDQKGNLINVFSMAQIHNFVANNIFYFAFPSSLIYSYLIFKSDKIEKIYGLGYYIFSFLIFFYILLLIYGPNPFESEFGMILQVTSQKIIALSWVVSSLILSIGIKLNLD